MIRLVKALVVGLLGGLGASGACVFFWGFLQNFIALPRPDLFQSMSSGAKDALILALGLPFAAAYWVISRRRSRARGERDLSPLSGQRGAFYEPASVKPPLKNPPGD